jgi:anti-sigma regulatory factor (Ser/Thr protein kinase)
MNSEPKKETESKTKPIEISITLPTNAYFIAGVRDFTLNLIKNTTDFSDQWAYRFQSVIDELCNNAIEFGSKPGDDIKINFKLIEKESIEISVEDNGTGPNKLKAADIDKLVKERADREFSLHEIRGRGLAKIVLEWSDELAFTDKPGGGIIVKVKKYLTDIKTQQLKQSLSLAGDETHIVL